MPCGSCCPPSRTGHNRHGAHPGPDRRRPGPGPRGFRLILETQNNIEVVGEAVDGVQAVELAGRLRPDVVLMDVRMPRLDGIQATRCLVGLRDAAQAETPSGC